MSKTHKHSSEVRARAVRLVKEARKDYPSLWSAVESIAPKIGCAAVTLHDGVKKHEIETGVRDSRVPWKTVESLELATLEWVTWFNHQRLLELLGYIPPAEAEDRYSLQPPVQAEHVCT